MGGEKQPANGIASDSIATTADSSVRKRTRDLPDLYNCHGCKTHVSNVGQDKLQTLFSEWRIVLLCRKCFARVRSAKICSYCFLDAAIKSECFFCPQCARLVHKDCVLQCKDFAPWSYGSCSGAGFSLCVDCWVPPRLLADSRRNTCRDTTKNTGKLETLKKILISRVSKTGDDVGFESRKASIWNTTEINGNPKQSILKVSGNGDDGGICLEDTTKDKNCVMVYSRRPLIKNTTGISGSAKQSVFRNLENGDDVGMEDVIKIANGVVDKNCMVVYSRRPLIRNTTGISGSAKQSIFRNLENGDDGGMEDVIKIANGVVDKKIVDASRARDKALRKRDEALRKAAAARRAVELASNALGLVASREGTASGSSSALDDSELAFQLHRAMNSSSRLSLNVCSVNSSCTSVRPMPVCNSSTALAKAPNTDTRALDNMVDMRICTTVDECQGSEDEIKKVSLKEGEGSCSNKLVIASSGSDDSMGAKAYFCEKDDVFRDELCQGESSVASKNEFSSIPDHRYLKKYSRRHKSLKPFSPQISKLIHDSSNNGTEFVAYSCEEDDAFRVELCRGKDFVALNDGLYSIPDRHLIKYSRRRQSFKSISPFRNKFIYDGFRESMKTNNYSREKDEVLLNEVCQNEDFVALKEEIGSISDRPLKKYSRRRQSLKPISFRPSKFKRDSCDDSVEKMPYSC